MPITHTKSNPIKGVLMKLNSEKFRRAVRGAGQGKVAKFLGCTQATMSLKMQKPYMLRVHEFYAICDFLNEDPDRYEIEGNYIKGDN